MSRSLIDLLSYESLVHAISGATGSVVGLTTFFPLDTIRTRLQVQESRALSSVACGVRIIQEEGLVGLYKGWFSVMSTLCVSNFVYFYSYNTLKLLLKKEGLEPQPMLDLILAYIAGVINVLITTPMWVANTRLKLQGTSTDPTRTKEKRKYNGMIDCLKRILREEGMKTLWAGTLPSLVLAGNPAIQFMVYEMLKRNAQKYFALQELSGLTYFNIGAIAKLVATCITYPLQLIQTRSRAGQNITGAKGRRGATQTLKEIISQHGWTGLYRGLDAKLAQTVLMAALMFLTYEKIAAFVFRLMGVKTQLGKTH